MSLLFHGKLAKLIASRQTSHVIIYLHSEMNQFLRKQESSEKEHICSEIFKNCLISRIDSMPKCHAKSQATLEWNYTRYYIAISASPLHDHGISPKTLRSRPCRVLHLEQRVRPISTRFNGHLAAYKRADTGAISKTRLILQTVLRLQLPRGEWQLTNEPTPYLPVSKTHHHGRYHHHIHHYHVDDSRQRAMACTSFVLILSPIRRVATDHLNSHNA